MIESNNRTATGALYTATAGYADRIIGTTTCLSGTLLENIKLPRNSPTTPSPMDRIFHGTYRQLSHQTHQYGEKIHLPVHESVVQKIKAWRARLSRIRLGHLVASSEADTRMVPYHLRGGA